MSVIPPRYREHAPHPALRGAVACYWSYRAHAHASRILPDACIDLIFRRPLAADLSPRGPWSAQLVGTMTRASISQSQGEQYLGVRFRPGEAARLLGLAARELTDRSFELALAWDPRVVHDLELELERARELTDLHATLDLALLARLDRASAPEHRVRRVLAAMQAGHSRIDQLARGQGLGERQLLRLFEHHVGAAPKLIARVFRLQLALARAAATPAARGSDLALAAGYADQAHFIRDCQALTGLSPEKLLRERAMSDPFNLADLLPLTLPTP